MRLLLGLCFIGLLCASPALAQNAAPSACSSDAINNTAIPADGPDAALPASAKARYATYYAQRGNDYAKCRDAAAARHNFDIAVSLDHNNFKIIARRADFYFDTGDYAAAADDLSNVIDHRAAVGQALNIREIYGNRAEAYRHLNRNQDALADLIAATEGAEGPPLESKRLLQFTRRRANVQFDLGQYDIAAAAYGKLAASDLAVCDDLRRMGLAMANLRQLDSAIGVFNRADRSRHDPAAADASCEKGTLELALGQAYAARHGKGDIVNARVNFSAALSADPGNAAAAAGLSALPTPPPSPTFGQPVLETVNMPAGISTNQPPNFCRQEEKNTYLDSISSASDVVNRNMSAVSTYVTNLLESRKRYDGNELLTYDEQIHDLQLYDQEWSRINAMTQAARRVGDQLLAYWHRVNDDKTLIVVCKEAAPAS